MQVINLPPPMLAAVELPKNLDPQVAALLKKFPAILRLGTDKPMPTHGVEHVIETEGRPVFAKARRLDPLKLQIVQKEFEELEAAGIVCRSNSPWASPLHLVPKKDGSFRPCGNYRRLNTITTPDRYPLPNIQDFSNKLHG